MYTGHLGIALGAKGLRPDVNLWLLAIASLAPDLIDFSLQAAGGPDSTLWTHSLPASAAFGLFFFAVAWLLTRNMTAALLVGLVASSHVFADLITSRLQLWPGGPPAGLHWYRRPLLDLTVESAVVIAGWLLYVRTLSRERRFSLAAWAMLVLLLGLQGFMETMGVS